MKAHYIKTNKTVRLPQKIIFYDTETFEERWQDLIIHKLKLGVARYVKLCKTKITKDKYYYFKTTDEFWDIVEKHTAQKTRLFLISHNQHFDFNVVDGFKQLAKRNWKLTQIVLESDIFLIRARKERKTLLIIDSCNYFKTSIEELGKMLNLPKLKVDFKNVEEKKLLEYCRRDVEILSEFFLKFLRFWYANDLGNFALSLAGLAFNSFKHKFMKTRILHHENKEVLELELNSYFGGRNECFYIGKVNETLYKLDVNSMYPFIMKFNKFPIKFKKLLYNLKPNQLKELLRRYLAIAEVHLNTNENAYPVRKNKLIFSIGTFKTTLATPELLYALENNHVTKIYRCALYDYDYVFKDYVDFYFRIKQEAERNGDKITRMFAKLMMNSLYGKFAQRVREFEKIDYVPLMNFGTIFVNDIVNNERYKLYFINSEAYKLKREEKLFYDSNVAIASHVTAYARMYLYYLMKKAGLNNVYYVDTDSLFVNKQGYENLKDLIGNGLGELKLEGISNNVIIFGCKDYIFENEIKLKGISNDSVKISDNAYLLNQFLKTKSLISKSIHGAVIIEERIKNLKREYDKAIVLENGRVKPFELKE